MASNRYRPSQGGGQQVVDEEGTVDQHLKRQILDARERVSETEEALYIYADVDAELESISRLQKGRMWASSVKQYLRLLEPLLRSDELPEAGYYYDEVTIGKVEFLPIDNQHKADDKSPEIPFAQAVVHNVDETAFKRKYGLSPETELPDSKVQTFEGLRSIITLPEAITKRWTIEIGDGPEPFRQTKHIQNTKTPPKHILENAIRHADEFRQHAGIGIEVGHRERDDQDLNPV